MNICERITNNLVQLTSSASLKSIILNVSKTKYLNIVFVMIYLFFRAKMTEEQWLNIITPPGQITEYPNRFVSYFFLTTWRGQNTADILVLFWFTAGIFIKTCCFVKSLFLKHTCNWKNDVYVSCLI